jgi:hypothetical protein
MATPTIFGGALSESFVDGRPWLHVDLSSSNCDDGLGAVGTEVTGFGVAWGIGLLTALQLGK